MNHIPKHKLAAYFLIVTSVLVLAACSQEKQNGFDVICQIYTEAELKHETPEKTADYIAAQVKTRVTDPEPIQAFSAVQNAVPGQVYSLFKQAAEVTLHTPWSCDAMARVEQNMQVNNAHE